MQAFPNSPQTKGVALKYGLIGGIVLGIIEGGIYLANIYLGVQASANGTTSSVLGISLLLTGLNFVLGLAAYFVIGILAAQKTGKVRTGTFAGMWEGGTYGVIVFGVSMIAFFTISLPRLLNNMPSLYASNPEAFRIGAIGGGVGFGIFGIALAIGLGAGLGALGGLIGKSTSKVARQPEYPPYPAQPFPNAPFPGQPYPTPYPGQPYPPNQPFPGQPYPASQPYPGQPYPPNQPYPGQPQGPGAQSGSEWSSTEQGYFDQPR